MDQLDEILNWLEEYKAQTACRGVVLGISGGKDSTVVAMLAKKVWGENVVGVLMPDGEQSDLSDAMEVVKTVNIESRLVNIGGVTSAIDSALLGSINGEPKVRTNIPPRVRMTVLYAIAQSLGYRVIGTGNASEAFIGWTTKWGDSAYDLNPIYHLTCAEVVKVGKILAKEFGLDERLVDKSPADGLTGRSDEDNFGFTYQQLENVMKWGGMDVPQDVLQQICSMHTYSEHKRRMPPVIYRQFPRGGD